MNKNILIVLGGAVMAAVLVAMLVQVSMGGKKQPSAVVESGVEVLVAAKDLKKGAELKEGDLRWQSWSQETLFKGAILREEGQEAEEALKGRLERGFTEGEALVRRAILKETEANYVAARLKEGERAIAIRVDAEGMVAGFITPGSFVDIILTYKQSMSVSKDESPVVRDMVELNIDKLATETILQNVRILAVDQKAERTDEDKDKVKVGKTVTLAVPIRDAEKLALASEMGTLTLAMRGVGDDGGNEKTPTITDARLITVDDEIHNEYLRLRKESGVSVNQVKIYNGAQVQTVPVN